MRSNFIRINLEGFECSKHLFLQRGSQASWLKPDNIIEHDRAQLSIDGPIHAKPRNFPARILPRFLSRAHTICSNVRSLPKNYSSTNQPIDTVALLSSYPCSSAISSIQEHDSSVRSFNKSFAEEFDKNLLKRLPSFHAFASKKSSKPYSFLQPILAMDSPESNTLIYERPKRRSFSIDSADSDPRSSYYTPWSCTENLNKPLPISDFSVRDKQAISDDYESHISWKMKNVRKDSFKKFTDWSNKVASERNYSRDNLDLKYFSESPQKECKRYTTLESVASITDGFRSKIQLSPHALNPSESFVNSLSLKEQLEGKVVSPKFSEKNSEEKSQQEVFERCRSSATSNDVKSLIHDDDEGLVDDVFDNHEVPKKLDKKKPVNGGNEKLLKSVLSTLELSKKQNESKKKRNSSSVRSSVSFKEKPKSVNNKTSTKSNKIASSNVIANPNTKPSRGSLKKSSNKPSTNSDYDRDRGRSRHVDSGHRESFKKNNRTNERGSDQDRDASDREHKDGSLNRSLSNTDTNLEDRIGLCPLKTFRNQLINIYELF